MNEKPVVAMLNRLFSLDNELMLWLLRFRVWLDELLSLSEGVREAEMLLENALRLVEMSLRRSIDGNSLTGSTVAALLLTEFGCTGFGLGTLLLFPNRRRMDCNPDEDEDGCGSLVRRVCKNKIENAIGISSSPIF